MNKLLIILLLFSFGNMAHAQERISIGHILNKKSGLEEITASYYSPLADTVIFTFYCDPDNGRTEYHIFAVKDKKAKTSSGIFCPQKVVVKAKTPYSTQFDTLNVAVIRKINQQRNAEGNL